MSVGQNSNARERTEDFRELPFAYGHTDEAIKWFNENSNAQEWWANLSGAERNEVERFTGSGFVSVNGQQYGVAWEDMDDSYRERIVNLYNALDKFQLKVPITVNRACDFKIFGSDDRMTMAEVKAFLEKSGGYVQNNGFMSFSTRADGVEVDGSGVVLKVTFPTVRGAGAYVAEHSNHKHESEWIANNNGVYRFYPEKMYKNAEGSIVVPGEWVGQAKAQTISKTYTKDALVKSKAKMKKGRKKK